MGQVEADKAAAVAVLHGVHELVDWTTQKVEVMQHENRFFVIAAEDLPERTLLLPPCVPRQSKVFEKSEHPFGVHVKVEVLQCMKRKVTNDSHKILRANEFSVIPEFKGPLQTREHTAVAGASGSNEDIEWVWGQGRAETMHPFWAVRRLTPEQLDKDVEACIKRNKTAVAGKQEAIPSINCELEEQVHSFVHIATVGQCVVNCTRLIKVPFLTNIKALKKGEELLLSLVVQVKEKRAVKRTWRDVSKEEQQNETNAKRGKD